MSMQHRVSRLAGMVACGLFAAAGGCGYSSSSLHPGSVRSVYVEMFQSKEFRRGLEMQLTEAVRKEIDRVPQYHNAPRNTADSVLSGEVLEVRQSMLGKDFETDQPRQMAATFVVSYRLKDMRTGRILAENKQFTETVNYVQPVGETFFLASEEAMDKLAERIVNSMETGW
jgi:hypothetical protein